MATALLMAVFAFVVGVSELLMAGVLDVVAADLGTSVAAAGSLIFWHALAYAVVPPVVLLVAAPSRRAAFAVSSAVFGASSILVALAPDFLSIALGRAVQGGAAGIVLAIAIATAGEAAGPARRGQAMATVLMGLSVALIVGVPLGVLAAERASWRLAFELVGAFGALMTLLILLKPSLGAANPRKDREASGFRLSRPQCAALCVSLVWMTAHSTMFSYVAPVLKDGFALGAADASLALSGFGVACLIGGYSGGLIADRLSGGPAAAAALLLNAAAIASFFVMPAGLAGAIIFMTVWGLTSWMSVAPIQSVMTAPGLRLDPDVALGLNNSLIQLGIGAGALAGGASIHLGLAALASWSAALLLGAAVLASLALGRRLPDPRVNAA